MLQKFRNRASSGNLVIYNCSNPGLCGRKFLFLLPHIPTPTTSALPLLWLEGLATIFGCYFNLYIIYIDYFHYMQNLSHEHQPRGAGGVLEDQFILDDEVLSGARERRLEDVTTTFGHDNSTCTGS